MVARQEVMARVYCHLDTQDLSRVANEYGQIAGLQILDKITQGGKVGDTNCV